MNITKTAWYVVETKEDLENLSKDCKELTLQEMASKYGLTKSKMYTVLRINDLKAKTPERKKKPKKEKVYKKDKELMKWVHQQNHGKLQNVYYHMICRCYKPAEHGYKYYGGRGIKVCEEWKKDCDNFFSWAKSTGYKEGLTLDRINVNGNYEPANCRWVTTLEQSYNKRNTRYITYKGETKTLLEWEEEIGISKDILADRIYKYKWNIEEALTRPPKNRIKVL